MSVSSDSDHVQPRSKPKRRAWRWVLAIACLTLLTYLSITFARLALARSQGEAAAARNDWKEAARSASTLLAIRPSDPFGSNLAVRALTHLNRAAEAETHRSSASPLDRQDLHLLANELLKARHEVEAASVYEEISKRWPDDLTSLRRLGALEMTKSRWDRAEAIAKRLIETPGGEVVGRTLAGSIYYNLGRKGIVAMLGMSVAEYDRVFQLDPDLTSMPLPRKLFWSQYAYGLIREGRSLDARRHLERVVVDDGEDATLLSLLGQALDALGEVEKAETAWNRAKRVDPKAAEPWLFLGRLALKQRRYQVAVEFLARASELSPQSVEPLYSLAQAYQNLGKTAEAERIRARIDTIKASTP